MDTAINSGDFLLDSRGFPSVVSGIPEILQRVLIRLTVKKGSFIYDTNLGSDLYKLKAGSKNIKGEALNMIREAISPLYGVEVDDVSIRAKNSGENLDLNIILSINKKREELEVVI